MIILDLDNCISNDAWRIPKIDMSKSGFERYHNYHSLAHLDEVGNEDLFATSSHDIIIATSRPEVYKDATKCWLKRHGISPILLLMRSVGDTSPSVAVKGEFVNYIFRMLGVRLSDIACAYDDRQDIVDMYRLLGINAEVRAIHNIKPGA